MFKMKTNRLHFQLLKRKQNTTKQVSDICGKMCKTKHKKKTIRRKCKDEKYWDRLCQRCK